MMTYFYKWCIAERKAMERNTIVAHIRCVSTIDRLHAEFVNHSANQYRLAKQHSPCTFLEVTSTVTGKHVI